MSNKEANFTQEQLQNNGKVLSAANSHSQLDGALPSSYAHDLDRALTFIQKHDQFLVVAHVNPDGDAISSTVAIGWLLSQWNKSFTMVNANEVPSKLMFLSKADEILVAEQGHLKEREPFQAVICVDCADYARIGSISDWVAPNAHILNIDHHPTNDRYGDVALIREDAAATAEILFDLFDRGVIPLSNEIATILYTGLLTDTGGFRYSNTTPHVMEIASKLLAYGVKGNVIAERLLEAISKPQMNLIQRGLSRLSYASDERIAWLYITPEDMQQTGASNEDLEGLVNYPRNIEGVEVGLLFKEVIPGRVKVSMRSAGDINVAAIAQIFDGGGHVKAAGCTVHLPLEEAIQAVVEQVKQTL
ncbi:DHH family phosphoesterase [Paenibacillus agilis]|uniref:Bifunctional oligoribonuclease/PAP phosphatase NrnA n=1 Tax=Paenibacillus agilis TaxID=3020863 RepID=A0A559J230_9BACL|nr:bifunctional oligoribonuclease/PAP phosphatase NrnA [Paenibacillus agilis]TVX93937.1 bifunctional oligoribonuclease/PAP phosphatase NrnA [Paenibacillus agilis]